MRECAIRWWRLIQGTDVPPRVAGPHTGCTGCISTWTEGDTQYWACDGCGYAMSYGRKYVQINKTESEK